MPKAVNDKNQIWYETENGYTKIGFTQSFIDTALDQCWHILPSSTTKIERKSPLLVVETNEGLVTIMSPITGYYADFIGAKAQDFPDQLTEADVVVSLAETRAGQRAPQAQVIADGGFFMPPPGEVRFRQPAPINPADLARPRTPVELLRRERLMQQLQEGQAEHIRRQEAEGQF